MQLLTELHIGRGYIKTYVHNKPIFIFTIEGKNPKLKSVLLNSHFDVTAVKCTTKKLPYSLCQLFN
jgi:acetylornithine deacetylase/succinyl-diaminopimelate desuccinylase-like protein